MDEITEGVLDRQNVDRLVQVFQAGGTHRHGFVVPTVSRDAVVGAAVKWTAQGAGDRVYFIHMHALGAVCTDACRVSESGMVIDERLPSDHEWRIAPYRANR